MTPDHRALAGLPDGPSHWLHSYPGHLSRTWTLSTGQSLLVRPIRHDDGELEEAFVSALSLESRYQRMLSGGTKVTPEWIDSMTHIDYHRHMAFVVTMANNGAQQFVGVGRYIVDSQKARAGGESLRYTTSPDRRFRPGLLIRRRLTAACLCSLDVN